MKDYILNPIETFNNLWAYWWKLKLGKCAFNVKLRTIDANPNMVDTIRNMVRPSGKKDGMKLTGMVVALSRFISKHSENGMPFFKLLKKAESSSGMARLARHLKGLKLSSPSLS
jgi:hypothetical protein